jgi:hypothetical protein
MFIFWYLFLALIDGPPKYVPSAFAEIRKDYFDSTGLSSSLPKRSRGRPRGSKNKPKY